MSKVVVVVRRRWNIEWCERGVVGTEVLRGQCVRVSVGK